MASVRFRSNDYRPAWGERKGNPPGGATIPPLQGLGGGSALFQGRCPWLWYFAALRLGGGEPMGAENTRLRVLCGEWLYLC
jgi:hypothetical protein